MLRLREIDRLRPSEEDLRLLWDLLEERPSWANISHPGEMPNWDAHVNHVKTAHKHWWIIEDQREGQTPFSDPLGSIYLSKQNEIGVAVLASRRHKGYATWAILKVIEMFPMTRLWANTAPGNEVSQKMFLGLGFKELQRTFILES